ncbi:MAG: hypothetical protein Kapaf2KO_13230 [Candidatus Kapaibacteriales bacterium]
MPRRNIFSGRDHKTASFYVSYLSKLVKSSLSKKLEEKDIIFKWEDFSLLKIVYHSDGVNQQRLAYLLNKEKGTVSRQIKELHSKGILAKEKDENDSRNNKIVLTKEGSEIMYRAHKIIGDFNFKMLRDFTLAERNQLKDFLVRMSSNITDGEIDADFYKEIKFKKV